MTSPVTGMIVITFVSDANTPAQWLPYVGYNLYTEAERLPVGTGTVLRGIPGVVRQGVSGLEFLMMDDVPVVVGSAPLWAQTMQAELDGRLAAITASLATLSTAVSAVADQITLIINNGARANPLAAVAANVTAIKTKVGA